MGNKGDTDTGTQSRIISAQHPNEPSSIQKGYGEIILAQERFCARIENPSLAAKLFVEK